MDRYLQQGRQRVKGDGGSGYKMDKVEVAQNYGLWVDICSKEDKVKGGVGGGRYMTTSVEAAANTKSRQKGNKWLW